MDTIKDQATQKPEEATTIGMFLKYTRLEQKKDLESISKALCIRKIYLKAIEEDDYRELPPVPYGMGFVRSYAAYLGLNAERIVQCYKEEALPKKEVHKPVVKAHPQATRPNKRQILIGLLVLIFFYALWLVGHLKTSSVPPEEEQPAVMDVVNPENISVDESENVQDIVVSQETEVKTEATAEDSTDESVQPQDKQTSVDEQPAEDAAVLSEEPSKPAADESRVVVKFKGTSWFQISDKSKKVYVSGIFGKGYEYRVPNRAGLIFSVGAYKNVDVYIDGKLVRIAGAHKQTNIDLDQYLNH